MIKKLHKENPSLSKSEMGFTLMELSVVVAILSILGSLGITNISKWMKFAQIDEAMSVLNMSLVECLSSTRSGTDPATISPPSEVIDNNRLEPANYKIVDSENKCNKFFIEPSNATERVLFKMGYQISLSGKVTKIGYPSDDFSSLPKCKRWAGTNCGLTKEQEDHLIFETEFDKKESECKEILEDARKAGKTTDDGSPEYTWDPTATKLVGPDQYTAMLNSCTKPVYLFKGAIFSSQAQVDEAVLNDEVERKKKLCRETVKAQEDKKTDGKKTESDFPNCTGETYYFCQGKTTNQAGATITNETEMNSCISQAREDACMKEVKKKADDGHVGTFTPTDPNGSCGHTHWMCDGTATQIEATYNSWACAGSGGGGGGGGGGGSGGSGGGGSGGGSSQQKAKDCLAKAPSGLQDDMNTLCRHLGGAWPNWNQCTLTGFYQCMDE